MELWKLDVKSYHSAQREYNNFKAWLFSLIIGQRTPTLRAQIRSHTDYANANNDGIALMKIVKSITHSYEPGREKLLAQVMNDAQVNYVTEGLLSRVAAANGHVNPDTSDKAQTRDELLVIRFINGANQEHQTYKNHLKNSYLDGTDIYPSSVHDAFRIMQRRPKESSNIDTNDAGLAFATDGQTDIDSGNVMANNRRDISHITCFNCNQRGHYANQCPQPLNQTNHTTNTSVRTANTTVDTPNEATTETQLVVHGAPASGGFSFTQRAPDIIPKSLILLDSQSTIYLFHNKDLLGMERFGMILTASPIFFLSPEYLPAMM